MITVADQSDDRIHRQNLAPFSPTIISAHTFWGHTSLATYETLRPNFFCIRDNSRSILLFT